MLVSFNTQQRWERSSFYSNRKLNLIWEKWTSVSVSPPYGLRKLEYMWISFVIQKWQRYLGSLVPSAHIMNILTPELSSSFWLILRLLLHLELTRIQFHPLIIDIKKKIRNASRRKSKSNDLKCLHKHLQVNNSS